MTSEMTGQWRVYNDNSHGFTHREVFRGEQINIEAGDFVLMDYDDAVLFRGQYSPMIMSSQGVQDPKSYKMIRIEAGPEAGKEEIAEENKVYVCMMDGKEFVSKKELDAYVKANFADYVVKDDALDKVISKTRKGK